MFLETIRAVDGAIQNITYHQARYEATLKHFKKSRFFNLLEFINPPKKGLFRCRVVYDLDGDIDVGYHEYKKRVINKLKLVYSDIEYPFKYSDRVALDELFLQKQECDDVLIVKDDLVSDTTIANVAFFDGKVWLSPKKPLLKGSTRARYLEQKKIQEADIKVEDLSGFSKIALLNAMVDFDIIEKKIEDVIC
ncbi:MAG: aminotransferase class IV family protein [Sulfurimonas sp.]|jgi:4-amino-4-deoxychorismate lyase|nr:aminotransferase class IV family protein [Sulfurimonadaceae bacterium]